MAPLSKYINSTKNLLTFVLLTMTLVCPVLALSETERCSSLFSRSIPELSQAQRQIIDSDPNVKAMREWVQGRKINILVSQYHGFDPRGNKWLSTGENYQSYLLVQILKAIFPHAEFPIERPDINAAGVHSHWDMFRVAAHQKEIHNRTNIFSFSAFDSAEKGVFRPMLEQDPRRIEMVDLKAGTIDIVSQKKQNVRKEMNWPNEASLAHIYDRFSTPIAGIRKGVDEYPDFSQIFEELQRRDYRTIVLTPRNSGGSSGTDFDLNRLKMVVPDPMNFFDAIYNLSDLLSGSQALDPQKRNLVINNTHGKMLKIYAASDLALVFGPINFFEPLSVGIPTVVIDNSVLRRGYSSEGMAHMLKNASEFPNFKAVSLWSDFVALPPIENVQTTGSHRGLEQLIATIFAKMKSQSSMPWTHWEP